MFPVLQNRCPEPNGLRTRSFSSLLKFFASFVNCGKLKSLCKTAKKINKEREFVINKDLGDYFVKFTIYLCAKKNNKKD